MASLALYVKTLGCKVNQVESETLLREFAAYDVELADKQEQADIIVVNTCSVTGEADAKARKALRKCARQPKTQLVIATGCSAMLHAKELETLEENITVLADKTRVAPYIIERLNLKPRTDEESLEQLRTAHPTLFRTRSFVKVQDGCTNFCSYCIVPYARGGLESTPSREVVEEVEKLARNGVKEIVLTGINIGRYRDTSQGIESLPQLVNLLTQTAIQRIRISSIEPVDITDEFLALFAPGSKVCEHLHIPLQSGSDAVLKAMNRNYTAQEYKVIVARLRSVAPDIALSTDVIVGFPGETDQDFEETLALCREVGFSKIHVFKYSKRKGTPAAEMQQVDYQVMAKRAQQLAALGDNLAQAYLEKMKGKPLEFLVEGEYGGSLRGTSREHITQMFEKGSRDSEGNVISVGSLYTVIG